MPVPALRGDDLHTMTVLPYLIAYHYGSDENPQFVTAHQLNGIHVLFYKFVFVRSEISISIVTLLLILILLFSVHRRRKFSVGKY